MPAIEVRGLEREFGDDVLAVAGVDLEVAEGEIYAFLGPERRRQDDDGPDADHPPAAHAAAPRASPGTTSSTSPATVRRAIGVALQEAALDPLMTGGS